MARSRDINKLPTYGLLREYKAMVGFEWAHRRGAHAIGIGRKLVAGRKTDTLALRVYVAEKRPLSELEPEELVPSSVRFLSRKAERESTLQTDVIETPPPRPEAIDPETRIRPVPGGVSGGISGSTGTIGGWVWDLTDDTIVLLSNNHVLLNTIGETSSSRDSGRRFAAGGQDWRRQAVDCAERDHDEHSGLRYRRCG